MLPYILRNVLLHTPQQVYLCSLLYKIHCLIEGWLKTEDHQLCWTGDTPFQCLPLGCPSQCRKRYSLACRDQRGHLSPGQPWITPPRPGRWPPHAWLTHPRALCVTSTALRHNPPPCLSWCFLSSKCWCWKRGERGPHFSSFCSTMPRLSLQAPGQPFGRRTHAKMLADNVRHELEERSFHVAGQGQCPGLHLEDLGLS